MPDPIIDPATIMVESSRPSPRVNPVLFLALAVASAIRSSSNHAEFRDTAWLAETASGRDLRMRGAIITEFARSVESFRPNCARLSFAALGFGAESVYWSGGCG